jgi:hypothetical protein
MCFHPHSVRRFRFLSWDFDERTRTAGLDYAFDDGPTLREEITFHGARPPGEPAARAALDRCLRHLHLVAGISYYKAAVPPRIDVETGPIPESTARFLDRLYLYGLGEFAYRNRIDLRDRIRFPFAASEHPVPPRLPLPRRTAVPVGGGKDSVVTIEALKAAGEPMVLISVGDPLPIREVATVAGVDRIVITRRLSPLLFELNRDGALNGHVPISAIIAFILTVAAVLYGFDAVAMSNERSANVANLRWNHLEINHQYSKSAAFERDMDALLASDLLPGLRYFSFLRPLSEIAIAAVFSRLDAYHGVFRSCNAAFRIDDPAGAWCRRCPKCLFVFLTLAPFLPRTEMVRIFGANLLAEPDREEGFAALLGLAEHRPFECVGETRECLAALVLLARSPEWRHEPLVRHFATLLLPRIDDARRLVRDVLAPTDTELLPARYATLLPSVPRPELPLPEAA